MTLSDELKDIDTVVDRGFNLNKPSYVLPIDDATIDKMYQKEYPKISEDIKNQLQYYVDNNKEIFDKYNSPCSETEKVNVADPKIGAPEIGAPELKFYPFKFRKEDDKFKVISVVNSQFLYDKRDTIEEIVNTPENRSEICNLNGFLYKPDLKKCYVYEIDKQEMGSLGDDEFIIYVPVLEIKSNIIAYKFEKVISDIEKNGFLKYSADCETVELEKNYDFLTYMLPFELIKNEVSKLSYVSNRYKFDNINVISLEPVIGKRKFFSKVIEWKSKKDESILCTTSTDCLKNIR